MTDGLVGPLAGQIALITGGSSGIGLAIGRRLAQGGASVALVGRADRTKVEVAADTITATGGHAMAFLADMASPDQISKVVDDVTSTMGDIDILVNSAGVWSPSPIVSLSNDLIDEMVQINLNAPMRMVAAVAPGMVERRSGQIVNIASIAAAAPTAGFSLYATTKAALIAFTKAGSLELAPFDVAMNCISPGNTTTPMNEHVRVDPNFAPQRERISRITPSNRMFTPADEIAEAAMFLVDGRVKGIYGTNIPIDEGRSAGLTAL
jgi:NAD(P)-dependent dehydrogenase (short-subunit alcohol dehydrogenase family)